MISHAMSRIRPPVRAAVVACVLVAAMAVPVPAHAAAINAYVSGSILFYIADPGVSNSVLIQPTAGGITIDDSVPVETGANCSHPNADLTYAVCSATGVTRVYVGGGDGNDFINYFGTVPLSAHGGTGNDTIFGDQGADLLWGDAGNDLLMGFGGSDTIIGGTGTDSMYGGEGVFDMVSYVDSPTGVVVTLDGVNQDGAAGENDLIASDIEDITGSQFADWLVGDAHNNDIFGLAGSDVLVGNDGDDHFQGDGVGTALGADYFFGGNGTDWVSYQDHSASQPVVADLDGATGDDGASGEGDTIAADVEGLRGSDGPDWLVGNDDTLNFLFGEGGADVLVGLGGDDTMGGGEGDDVMLGGDGNDSMNGENGNDILKGENGSDRLVGNAGTDSCDVGPGGTSALYCE